MPGLGDSCASPDQSTQSWLGRLARAGAVVAWQERKQAGVWPWTLMSGVDLPGPGSCSPAECVTWLLGSELGTWGRPWEGPCPAL